MCVVDKKDPVCQNVPVAFIIKRKGYEHLTNEDVLNFIEGKFFTYLTCSSAVQCK